MITLLGREAKPEYDPNLSHTEDELMDKTYLHV